MSIFTRRQIEIDPEDQELVETMSRQQSESTLFQTETLNITKLEQALKEDGQEAFATPKQTKKRSKNYRPSSMSDSFKVERIDTSKVLQKEQQNINTENKTNTKTTNNNDGYKRSERKNDSDIQLEGTSALDQTELQEYLHKTRRVNTVMVSLIIGVIIVIVVVAIVLILLSLRQATPTSPLGGV